MWGELSGTRGNQMWLEKWKNADGQEYNERFDDDGLGNTTTLKKGKSTRYNKENRAV